MAERFTFTGEKCWTSVHFPGNGTLQRLEDDKLSGFFLQITKNGKDESRSWVCRWTPPKWGKQVSLTVCRCAEMAPKLAREAAKTLMKNWKPPLAEEVAAEKPVLFKEEAEAFYEAYCKRKNSGKHQTNQRWARKRCEVFDERPMLSITPQDITKFLQEIEKTQIPSANRIHSYLSKLFTWSCRRVTNLMNPCIGHEKLKEPTRKVIIPMAEFQDFAKVWQQFKNPLKDVLIIPLLCGWRRGAIIKFSQGTIDKSAGMVMFDEELEGVKNAAWVPLPPEVLTILEKAPRISDQRVRDAWEKLQAEFPSHIWTHDMRRTWSSFGKVWKCGTPAEIDELMSHSQGAMRDRYMVMISPELRKVANRISKRMWALLNEGSIPSNLPTDQRKKKATTPIPTTQKRVRPKPKL